MINCSATANKICCVTGDKTDCVPRKELLGKSFCNQDLLKAPNSDWVGVDAYEALSYKWERMSLWFCDGNEFQRLQRTDVRTLVFDGAASPQWACYVTTGYKKHGALVTPVNSKRFGVFRFEALTVDCTDNQKVLSIYNRLEIELRLGLWRSIMESLNCPVHVMKEIGIERWDDFEQWAKPIYKSPLYKFMCYLLPSQEELKAEK